MKDKDKLIAELEEMPSISKCKENVMHFYIERDDVIALINKHYAEEVTVHEKQLKTVEDLLIMRDGGDHDVDCKTFRGRGCNCGRTSVYEYFKAKELKERDK